MFGEGYEMDLPAELDEQYDQLVAHLTAVIGITSRTTSKPESRSQSASRWLASGRTLAGCHRDLNDHDDDPRVARFSLARCE